MVIDSHLSLEAQIRSVCKKAFYQIRRISRIRKFLDPPTCNSLVCALVSPHLDYANSLYYGLPEYLLDRLQRVQNAAARLVIGANRFASSKALLKSLHWLPVRARIQYKIAVLVYRCINGCAPSRFSASGRVARFLIMTFRNLATHASNSAMPRIA